MKAAAYSNRAPVWHDESQRSEQRVVNRSHEGQIILRLREEPSEVTTSNLRRIIVYAKEYVFPLLLATICLIAIPMIAGATSSRVAIPSPRQMWNFYKKIIDLPFDSTTCLEESLREIYYTIKKVIDTIENLQLEPFLWFFKFYINLQLLQISR